MDYVEDQHEPPFLGTIMRWPRPSLTDPPPRRVFPANRQKLTPRDLRMGDNVVARTLTSDKLEIHLALVCLDDKPPRFYTPRPPRDTYVLNSQRNVFERAVHFTNGVFVRLRNLEPVAGRAELLQRLFSRSESCGRVVNLLIYDANEKVLFRAAVFFATRLGSDNFVFSVCLSNLGVSPFAQVFESLTVYHSADVRGNIREEWALNSNPLHGVFFEPPEVDFGAVMTTSEIFTGAVDNGCYSVYNSPADSEPGSPRRRAGRLRPLDLDSVDDDEQSCCFRPLSCTEEKSIRGSEMYDDLMSLLRTTRTPGSSQ